MPVRKKGFIAELRRQSRDLKARAPSDPSRSDAADAAERRLTELKAHLSEDPGWIARRRPKSRLKRRLKTGRRSSDK